MFVNIRYWEVSHEVGKRAKAKSGCLVCTFADGHKIMTPLAEGYNAKDFQNFIYDALESFYETSSGVPYLYLISIENSGLVSIEASDQEIISIEDISYEDMSPAEKSIYLMEKTGFSTIRCRFALEKCNNDINIAERYLFDSRATA